MEQLKNNTAELQEILDTINTLPEKFDTSDANVTANKMLAGYSGYANGQKVEGNIQSRGAQTITPSTTAQEIPAGVYLAGKQTIQGDAKLIASNIKSGVNIFGVTGTYGATYDGTVV